MSLLNVLGMLGSSLDASSSRIAVVSRNIANAGVAGSARKTLSVQATMFGGVQSGTVGRAMNDALNIRVLQSTSDAASSAAIADAIATLSATAEPGGAATDGTQGASIDATLSAFRNTLETSFATPASTASAQAVVEAAKQVATSLNQGAAAIDQIRSRAAAEMGTAVGTINSLLVKFGEVNQTIVAGLKGNADVTDAMDSRDGILRQLAGDIGISTVESPNGSVSIYTDGGVTLFQDRPRTVAINPGRTTGSTSSTGVVTIDGVPVTGSGAPMALRSGSLAGLARVSDVIAPRYQAQLDQIANALVTGFQETDQSTTPTLPPLPGLFTFSGATGMPGAGDIDGLAKRLKVNGNVDPENGGNVDLLRDGGISAPGNAAYSYNPSGAASFTGRVESMLAELSATRSFDPAGGVPAVGSILDYADGSISWIQAQHKSASELADYQSSVASQATAALGNATGVNLDDELNNMLSLENSYGATARLLSMVQNMFSTFVSAVGRQA